MENLRFELENGYLSVQYNNNGTKIKGNYRL